MHPTPTPSMSALLPPKADYVHCNLNGPLHEDRPTEEQAKAKGFAGNAALLSMLPASSASPAVQKVNYQTENNV